MENIRVDTGNSGVKLRASIWFTITTFLTYSPRSSAECFGLNITVATYPPGTIHVPYGNPLEIFCVAEKYTSDDLEFSLAGKFLDSERINGTTRRLYIENPDKQLKAYYCRNKKTGRKCVNRVVVDTPPANLTDFNCISRNLDSLKCSWTTPFTYTSVMYTLTLAMEGGGASRPCVGNKEESMGTKIAYCEWDTTSNPRYRQQSAMQHFDLTARNIFGWNNQTFSIDHYSVVKPDPPFNLEVVKIGTHSVGLKWSIPYNMVELLPCGVDHIIEYQLADIDNSPTYRVDTSTLQSTNQIYKFLISDLPYAERQYKVRIYIKSRKAVMRDYWSDFSYIVFNTVSDIPHRPPEMIAGAFDQGALADKRTVFVYWKQLEEHEKVGANFTYKVLVTQGNTVFPIIYPDESISLSHVVLREVPLKALSVSVWSLNINGSSLNSSHLYIPAFEDTQSLGVTSFTRISYENGTYELYWSGKQNVDNYTLFWCQHERTKICLGRINFTVLPPNHNNYVIVLNKEHRYQFAISANSGVKSSGMVWAATCDISNRFGMYEFPVRLMPDALSKTSVPLRWSMDCSRHEL